MFCVCVQFFVPVFVSDAVNPCGSWIFSSRIYWSDIKIPVISKTHRMNQNFGYCLFVPSNIKCMLIPVFHSSSFFSVILFTQNKNLIFSCCENPFIHRKLSVFVQNIKIFWVKMRFSAHVTYHRNRINKCKSEQRRTLCTGWNASLVWNGIEKLSLHRRWGLVYRFAQASLMCIGKKRTKKREENTLTHLTTREEKKPTNV